MSNKIKDGGMHAKRVMGDIITYIFLIVLSVIWLIPFFWLVMQSFRDGKGQFISTFLPKAYTVNNYKARGSQRYAVTVKEKGVQWASKNMLALGWIILGGLLLHLFNFWSKMQLVEVLGHHENSLGFSPQDGAALIQYTFSQWYYVVIYLVWFFALWFHLTHGVWSMFQTVGWANDTWYPRLKGLATVVASIVFLGFAAVVVVYFVQSICPCSAGVC